VGAAPQLGQRPALELDDVRLVDLVHGGARRPVQAVGARVEAGGEDDGLRDARVRRPEEEVVEEHRPHGHVVGHPLHADGGFAAELGRVEFAGCQAGQHVDADGADQGFCEGVVDQGMLGPARHGPRRSHHRRRRSDARGEVPGVAFGTCHRLSALLLS
jgi:hypothetical protein